MSAPGSPQTGGKRLWEQPLSSIQPSTENKPSSATIFSILTADRDQKADSKSITKVAAQEVKYTEHFTMKEAIFVTHLRTLRNSLSKLQALPKNPEQTQLIQTLEIQIATLEENLWLEQFEIQLGSYEIEISSLEKNLWQEQFEPYLRSIEIFIHRIRTLEEREQEFLRNPEKRWAYVGWSKGTQLTIEDVQTELKFLKKQLAILKRINNSIQLLQSDKCKLIDALNKLEQLQKRYPDIIWNPAELEKNFLNAQELETVNEIQSLEEELDFTDLLGLYITTQVKNDLDAYFIFTIEECQLLATKLAEITSEIPYATMIYDHEEEKFDISKINTRYEEIISGIPEQFAKYYAEQKSKFQPLDPTPVQEYKAESPTLEEQQKGENKQTEVDVALESKRSTHHRHVSFSASYSAVAELPNVVPGSPYIALASQQPVELVVAPNIGAGVIPDDPIVAGGVAHHQPIYLQSQPQNPAQQPVNNLNTATNNNGWVHASPEKTGCKCIIS